MKPTLLALHGFTLNGAMMQRALGPLEAALSAHVDLVYPDGPHTCSPEAVDRLYRRWKMPRLPPPHRTWWDSSDDGSVSSRPW